MELITSYERKGIKKVAANLLGVSMDVSKVVELTELSEQEVKELKSRLQNGSKE